MVLIDGKSLKRPVEPAAGRSGAAVADGNVNHSEPTPTFPAMGGGMGGFGMGGGLASMPGMPGAGMGNFDFFAHMAAAARMQAAMAQTDTAEQEEEERERKKKKKKQDDGPAAFDKEALMRLAKQAAQAESIKPPEPAPEPRPAPAAPPVPTFTPTSQWLSWAPQPAESAAPPTIAEPAPVESAATAVAPDREAAGLVTPEFAHPDRLPEAEASSAVASVGGAAAAAEQSAATLALAPSEATSVPAEQSAVRSAVQVALKASTVAVAKSIQPMKVERARKDSSSISSILQNVKINVARGRDTRLDEPSREAQQAFGVVGGGGGAGASFTSLSSMLESLTSRLEDGVSSPESVRDLGQDVLAMLPKLEPPRATELVVRVHAADILRTREFLEEVIQTLMPSIPKFNSPHLTRILGVISQWAISCADAENEGKIRLPEGVARDFFGAAATELSLRLMDVVPRDLSQIATALASVGLIEMRLFGSLARAAVARSERFLPQEIVTLADAFDKACLVHTALAETLARCLRANMKDVAPRDLLRGTKALAICGVRDEELGQAIGDKLPKQAQAGALTPEEFCSLAWFFCTLGMYHDHLFRAVFRTLEEAAVVPGETLCQMYEIHVTLRAFRHDLYKPYELPSDTVQSLLEHYRKHKGGKGREYRIERSGEKIHKDVAETLRDVLEGSIHRQHQTAIGFNVDIAALRRKGSSKDLRPVVFVEIDGPHSLLQSLDPQGAMQVGQPARVRGDVLLKRRVLQKHGFRIAVISEEVWRTLDESREKREFLREVLRNAGVHEDRFV